jgi:RHS repeat-associated protein
MKQSIKNFRCMRLQGMAHFLSLTFCLLALKLATPSATAATFPGNARVEISDSAGALTVSNNQLSVSCWFRISIPTGTNLTENMVLLANRVGGAESDQMAYLLRFNIFSGDVEFVANGASGSFTNRLVEHPYLDRWYHVAVTRRNSHYVGYADGREVFDSTFDVGSISNPGGVTVAGLGNGRYFWGDIQEVAIYQTELNGANVFDRMFQEQATRPGLRGYYKLGFSTNQADFYKNFATNPPPSTTPGVPAGPGVAAIEFEETDRGGEQSAFDSRKNHGEQALTPLSGSFSWEQVAFARPVPGVVHELRFGYSSALVSAGSAVGALDPYVGPSLSPGWRHTFETRVLPDTDHPSELRLIHWNGAIDTWSLTNGVYRTRHKEYRGELSQPLLGSPIEWTTPQRLIYRFRPLTDGQSLGGRLYEIQDFNSNRVQVVWDDNSETITRVIDTAGGVHQFNYNGSYLNDVTFGAWRVSFSYDASNRLASKTLTNTSGLYTNVNTTWQFTYSPSNGLLERIIDPRGNTNVLIQYDKYGRKTNEIDALGRANQTRYGVPAKRQITRLDPATNSWIETYDRKGRILSQQDPLTNITSYTYDDAGNRTSVTEPLGWQTFFGYDSRANVIARTNALGQVTRWNFHPFFNKATNEINTLGWTNRYLIDDATGNLLRHTDDFGTLVSYTYASNGLVLTNTDGNTNTTWFTYDTNGFLISRTDPATNTTQFEYNDVGWKTSEIDPLYNWTDYEYDLNGNAVRVTDPLFRRFFKIYDGNGNLIASSDGKGRFTTNVFDRANQKIITYDRAGNTNLFSYTSRGKLDRITNALGFVTSHFYDAANRLTNLTDTLTNSVTSEFDRNGNAIAVTDQVGQRWSKTFDRLNRVIAETDPQGNIRQTSFDPAGRIYQITTPNGYPSTHAYDGRGRLTKWTDAEGFDWIYTYDGNGNIIDIEDALHGHYVMTYGPRNERTLERNQDTNTWTYRYDELLRLKQQTDPNGTIRTLQYDEAGRMIRADFNTGRFHTLLYDDNNNVEIVTRRDGGAPPVPTRFLYDALDRPVEQSDVHRQTVTYGYDALGRNTSVGYPGGKALAREFDAMGRMTNQVFDFGATKFTNSYAYDRVGRITQRQYPNGVVQSNTFDASGRLTNLTYSASGPQPATNNPVQIALGYAYDRNGNKTSRAGRGLLEWSLPPLTDEHAAFTPSGKLKTRTIETNGIPALSNQLSTINYLYDPSGNLTNASIGTQSWALTYDEDNRTTCIRWTTNAQTTTISNRYDALGRRVSRTLNGTRTDYVLDLSGDMERILCDMDAAGIITAWYVHGPDLAFKVDAAGALVCYHADAEANIVALTGTNGVTLAQYAYTPYGRLLGSTNFSQLSTFNSQPYLFVGSQGVMEELPGLHFMRARYYSAEVGVFLSTDPVKKIGPGWKPEAFSYANGNPNRDLDPNGEFALPAFVLGAAVGMVKGFATEVINQSVSAMTGGRFDWDEVITSTAAEGLGEGAHFATGSSEVGGAVSGVYRGYIDALSKGESYSLKDGLIDALVGAGTDYVEGKALKKFVPKVSLTGGNYFGDVRGPNASTLKGAFTGSHFRNGLQQTVFNTSMKVTSTALGNLSSSSRTPAPIVAPSVLNRGQATPPASNLNVIRPGQSLTIPGSGRTTYTVRPGDTLGNIGFANGTTATAIGQANSIQNLNRIYPGQVLTIPGRR